MPFYHDEANKTVFSAPDVPTAYEKKSRKGEPQGWTISAIIEITRADNYIDPKTGQWKYPTSQYPQEWYESRDTRERAIGYFKSFKYPKLPEISPEEYLRLRSEYNRVAHSNKPPSN